MTPSSTAARAAPPYGQHDAAPTLGCAPVPQGAAVDEGVLVWSLRANSNAAVYAQGLVGSIAE